MKPIIIKNSFVPKLFSWFFPVSAITLFPFIFVADKEAEDWLIIHETIHIKQYIELLIVGFPILYLLDFLRGLWKYKKVADAYHSIRLEQEAYRNEGNPYYLEERTWFAWRKYEI
tara:strand:+ start:462 stop:806 length:345 start_codon:yes stop_codon:yes gene_type:complete